jgi:type I restriction enzyme, R subunit
VTEAPEALARQDIDGQLLAAGWVVQDYKSMNIHAADGVAVREFPLKWDEGGEKKRGFADYLLYAKGQVIGVVEAKPAGYTLKGVETQSAKYAIGLPDDVPAYARPIPFSYESTGKVTQFTNGLDPDPRSREIFSFHRPEELVRLVGLVKQLRGRLREMPAVDRGRLWKVQHEAIENLEKSLSENRPRSLVQMATGSGKTFTACSACYRLIKHAKAKRILFLVDRNNLGRQTLNEFQQFSDPSSGYKFTEEYNVQHLRGNTIDPASKVVITTIQRLFSMLKGDEDFDEENEEGSVFETGSIIKEPVFVEYSARVPIETFDFVVIDECHRSIYNVWRQVLDYFDASLVGLTATPTPQTLGFFQGNVVQDYSHEKAVADGVNVGYNVYRIKTKVSEGGGTLLDQAGQFVPHRDRRTREITLKELDDDLTYTANQLDRDVVAEQQLRLVIRTFRDKLSTEIFPGRTEVPKTLVFAKQDSHAEDIVRVIREEFGKGNDFCKKITSKTTGASPEDLLSQFRNSYNPRIAVTVDMIATGTDVKALECLLFLRNVNSASYFEQMKGRGVRIIGSDDLQSVTPDAKHKTHFVIVDAVGVCERDKTISKPLDRQPTVGMDRLLQVIATGAVSADIVSTLAARLARLARQLDADQKSEISDVAEGKGPGELAGNLLASIDADRIAAEAAKRFELPEGQEPTEEQFATVERESMIEAMKPFMNPALRDTILNINRQLEQVIDEITPDELLSAGYDEAALDAARSKLADFREWMAQNKDEIEALQILYSRPHRAGLRYGQVKALAEALKKPPLSLHDPASGLWSLYEALEPDQVKGKGGSALVDLVAIVRHEVLPDEPLVPLADQVEARFHEWLSEKEHLGQTFTDDQRKWLDAIKDHIATSLLIETNDFQEVPFAQMGGLGAVHAAFGESLDAVIAELNERLAA